MYTLLPKYARMCREFKEEERERRKENGTDQREERGRENDLNPSRVGEIPAKLLVGVGVL